MNKAHRVLIVEDEALVAMLLETILEDMGHVPVGPAATVEEALSLIASDAPLHAALLDINLAGQEVFPVAAALAERGVPFVFSSGYGAGGVPQAWQDRPTLQKPFTEAAVHDALNRALGVARV
jgi:CheY-like chemotaxis protein